MSDKLSIASRLRAYHVRNLKSNGEYLTEEQQGVLRDALTLYIEGEE